MSLTIIKEVINAVEDDGVIDKAEAFKINGLLLKEAGFNERKMTGEAGEFIAEQFYGVENLGKNTKGYDLIDKQNRKIQVKMRHRKGDVDNLNTELFDVICVIMYDDDFNIEIYEATSKEFLSNTYRERANGSSTTCRHFLTYATKVGDYDI